VKMEAKGAIKECYNVLGLEPNPKLSDITVYEAYKKEKEKAEINKNKQILKVIESSYDLLKTQLKRNLYKQILFFDEERKLHNKEIALKNEKINKLENEVLELEREKEEQEDIFKRIEKMKPSVKEKEKIVKENQRLTKINDEQEETIKNLKEKLEKLEIENTDLKDSMNNVYTEISIAKKKIEEEGHKFIKRTPSISPEKDLVIDEDDIDDDYNEYESNNDDDYEKKEDKKEEKDKKEEDDKEEEKDKKEEDDKEDEEDSEDEKDLGQIRSPSKTPKRKETSSDDSDTPLRKKPKMKDVDVLVPLQFYCNVCSTSFESRQGKNKCIRKHNLLRIKHFLEENFKSHLSAHRCPSPHCPYEVPEPKNGGRKQSNSLTSHILVKHKTWIDEMLGEEGLL